MKNNRRRRGWLDTKDEDAATDSDDAPAEPDDMGLEPGFADPNTPLVERAIEVNARLAALDVELGSTEARLQHVDPTLEAELGVEPMTPEDGGAHADQGGAPTPDRTNADDRASEERIEVLERQLQAARVLEDRLTTQNVSDQRRLEEALHEIASLGGARSEAQERVIAAEAQVSKLEAEIGFTSTRLTQLEEAHEGVRTHAEEMRARAADLEIELTQSRRRVAELEQGTGEADSLRARLEQVEREATRKVEEFHKAATEARAEAHGIKEHLEAELARTTGADGARVAAEQRAATAEAQVAKLDAELGFASARLSQLEQAHETINARAEEAETRARELETAASDATRRIAELEEAEARGRAALAQEQERATHQIRELERRLQAATFSAPDGAVSPTSRDAELEALVAELEARLEATEVRARHAYAAAEAAEAALRFAKERGEVR